MASKLAPKTDKSLTKKAIKNLKRNKHRTDKHRAKSSAPKLAQSPALELAKTTLRGGFSTKAIVCNVRLNGHTAQPNDSSRLKPVRSRRGTLTKEAPATCSTRPTQVWVPNQAQGKPGCLT